MNFSFIEFHPFFDRIFLKRRRKKDQNWALLEKTNLQSCPPAWSPNCLPFFLSLSLSLPISLSRWGYRVSGCMVGFLKRTVTSSAYLFPLVDAIGEVSPLHEELHIRICAIIIMMLNLCWSLIHNWICCFSRGCHFVVRHSVWNDGRKEVKQTSRLSSLCVMSFHRVSAFDDECD